MGLSPHQLREIFDQTVVVRQPRYGIVSGYHELPYVCVGEGIERDTRATRISGKIQVSPRFLIRPHHLEPSYQEIFGEEHMPAALAGRMFGFLGFKGRPVECKSEYLKVEHLDKSVEETLNDALDYMARMEDITTGVLVSPNPEYFPVSVERLIAAVLEDEFRA
jgi:hypothetical protein